MLFLLIKHNPSKKGNKKENESTQSPHYSYIMPMCNAGEKRKKIVFVQRQQKETARGVYSIVLFAEIMIK